MSGTLHTWKCAQISLAFAESTGFASNDCQHDVCDHVTFRIKLYYLGSTPIGVFVRTSQGSLNFCDLSFTQLHLTIYVIAYYLILSYCVTFTLAIPKSLSMSGNDWIIFCCTFVQFTIVVLIWYDFQSYSIVLSMSIYSQVFQPCSF